MLKYDFESSVGCWITLVYQTLRRDLTRELASEGITSRQWEVLCWIAIEGELSQAELSERIGIEAPTLVGILDRMERDGWLERFSCPKDRRRKRMRVTPKAEEEWERIADCAHRVRSKAVQGFSAEELLRFREYCDRIRDNINSTSPPSERAGRSPFEDSSAELLTQNACEE